MNKVLFIDDSEATRCLISSYLETIDNCECYTVARENYELIGECDLILIDYELQYTTGEHVADSIVALYPDKQIYIYTGHDTLECDYPVVYKNNFKSFIDVVNTWINKRDI